MNAEKSEKLIKVNNLVKAFTAKRSFRATLQVRAVDGVSFDIYRGETFGLVGESGCGKSTLGRTIMGLYAPTSGSVRFAGDESDTGKMSAQMIFQDPFSSLNPFMRVRDIVAEPLELQNGARAGKNANKTALSKTEVDEKVAVMLQKVGLSRDDMRKFPRQFSGGQRQRISIARALVVKPQFVFCDEPISALDVSIQAQVVNLLEDLQKEYALTYLFVAHDLSMVRHISHRIAVMYRGKIVEIADSAEIYRNPLHPYTKTLLDSVPIPDPKLAQASDSVMHCTRKRAGIPPAETCRHSAHDVPSANSVAHTCAFAPRCPNVCAKCGASALLLHKAHNTSGSAHEHLVACALE